MSAWTVRLGFYSLEAGAVGCPTWQPIDTPHETPEAAMLWLDHIINEDASRASTLEIITPAGEPISLNECYRRTFGCEPGRVDGATFTYPKLKGWRARA